MRIRPALCAALVLASGALASAPAAAQTSISLIAISEQGLLSFDLDRIEKALRRVVPTLGELEVQPRAQTMEHFTEARGLGIDCQARDVECATKIGVIAGADEVLLLRAANKEGSFYLTLLLVDVNDGGEKRVTQWVPVGDPGFQRGIEEAAVRLFAPDRHRGDLKLRLTPPGATVTLDGKAAPGRSGAGVIAGLRAGTHQVEVRHDGYQPYSGSVQVRFQETSELLVALEPLEEGATDPAEEPAPVADGSDEPVAEATDGAPASDPEEAEAEAPALSPLVIGGGVVAGVGAAGVIGGSAIALIGSALTSQVRPGNADERRGYQALGLAGLAGAVLSGAVVVAGGAALAWGLADEERVE